MNCRFCLHTLPLGKYHCKHCGKWTTEESIQSSRTSPSGSVVRLSEVEVLELDRIKSGPWDYVFGGGIVKTSTTLIGGKRGSGKSTLFLQMASAIAKVLKLPPAYIATEESNKQIKARANRLDIDNQKDIIMISAMGGLPNLPEILLRECPCIIFLDSLQGLAGESEDMALALARLMKDITVKLEAPTIMSAHVNKSDEIAGLEAVQHVVDCVMTFFPDDVGIRELMVEKNRDGKAYIATTFKMTEKGLEVLELEVDVEEDGIEEEDDE